MLLLFRVTFYHFLSSRHLDSAERQFSSDLLVPFPDLGAFCSRGESCLNDLYNYITYITFQKINMLHKS